HLPLPHVLAEALNLWLEREAGGVELIHVNSFLTQSSRNWYRLALSTCRSLGCRSFLLGRGLLLFLSFGRRFRGVVQLARNRLLLDGAHGAFFLLQRHVLVLRAVQDQVKGLAFDDLGRQRLHQIVLLKSGADTARGFIILSSNPFDLVVDVI